MDIAWLLKSKEYKQGYRAGEEGKDLIDNPYSDAATSDNLKRGMGASPWWETKYKPFIDWQLGCLAGRQPAFEDYLNKHFASGDD